MFFAETVDLSSIPWLDYGLPVAATVAGIFAVVYSLRFSVDVFLGPLAKNLPLVPHEPARWMRVPIEVLVLLCLTVGIFPQWSIGPALDLAAQPVVGGALPSFSLAIWHGVSKPLVMSLIALAGGIALYCDAARIAIPTPAAGAPAGRQRLFHGALYGLDRASRAGVRWLSTYRCSRSAAAGAGGAGWRRPRCGAAA
jgi:multicomponent K+:H+ antiporter subunit A